MKHSKGIRLLQKYLYGKPNLEEKARIDKWYEGMDESKTVIDPDDLPQVKEQIYQNTWAELNSGTKLIPLYKRPFFRIAVAAMLVLGTTGAYFLFFKSKPETTIAVIKQQPLTNDVAAPASNKAILTLDDGTTIVLDSASNGSLAQQGNATVAKLNDGKITYNAGAGNNNEVHYNTLKVPKGSKPVQLVLADGSLVWLNVASSITYPTAFAGKERKVEIMGEVYFEVAHNEAMPFKVKHNDVEVQVLGTHFNMNTYDDENSLKVTLLEGAVNVDQSGKWSMSIKPGQQAEVFQQEKIKLNKNVDIDEVMAWKNGWFNFNSLQVMDIMRQIEKWYDVDVNYEGKPGQKHFSGVVSRDNNVSEVLKIMEQAGIKFKIEGKKITVIK